jgi:predicted Rossmann fold flavoprotein
VIKHVDAIILGAGAAGLMCAAKASARNKRIALLDHADAVGKKILISGGGRCNFTNLDCRPERFLSQNPHFAKSALGRFSARDFIDMVDAAGITWHEKTLGQLFCDGSARQIVAMLVDQCSSGVEIATHATVRSIAHTDGNFRITTDLAQFQAPALVVATGGPSIPKMGATGFAYDIARQFEVPVITPLPALVPLTLSGDEACFHSLAGVAMPTQVHCGKVNFLEASLFTHRGLSGPAILQISSYWNQGEQIKVNFLPNDLPEKLIIDAKRTRPRATLRSVLTHYLPERLAAALSDQIGLTGNLADQSDRALSAAGNRLANWTFHPSGTEGFAKAEVTRGGIDTDALDQRTLCTKKIPGLFFIGEAVDVTGWLGGYNFQWAWASAAAAAEAL